MPATPAWLRRAAAALVGLGLCSCSGGAQSAKPPAHSPSPLATAAAPAPTPSPSATPSPSPAPQALTLTGPGLSASVTRATAVGPCGKLPQGFVADLQFQVGASPLAISIVISPYTGPGVYQAPPAQVSAHTVGLTESAALYAGIAGEVTVLPGGTAGTVDEVLLKAPDQYLLKGGWSCG